MKINKGLSVKFAEVCIKIDIINKREFYSMLFKNKFLDLKCIAPKHNKAIKCL